MPPAAKPPPRCLFFAAALVSAMLARSSASGSEPVPGRSQTQVALLTTGADKRSAVCVGDFFITLASREGGIDAAPGFFRTPLDSDALFDHPFALWSGEGHFELSDTESTRLRLYLARGGFILAAPGCSNAAWQAALFRAIHRAFPEVDPAAPAANATKVGPVWFELPADHPVFHTVFDINGLSTRPAGPVSVSALQIDGRIAMIYCSAGLNDASSAPAAGTGQPGCCCCGTAEVTNAAAFNANVLSYAFTR